MRLIAISLRTLLNGSVLLVAFSIVLTMGMPATAETEAGSEAKRANAATESAGDATAAVPDGANEDISSVLDQPLADYSKTRRCINMQRVTETKILNKQLIVFYEGKSRIWVNQPPNECRHLDKRATPVYDMRSMSVCSFDTIHTVREHARGPAEISFPCQLGKFEEITPEQLKVLQDEYDPKRKSVLEVIFGG